MDWGFVRAASNARGAIESGDIGALSFEVYPATGVICGAALAIRGPLRTPEPARATRALAGGVLMGIGGTVAHGCNIGNGLTGLQHRQWPHGPDFVGRRRRRDVGGRCRTTKA